MPLDAWTKGTSYNSPPPILHYNIVVRNKLKNVVVKFF